jgi:hypothetical protein
MNSSGGEDPFNNSLGSKDNPLKNSKQNPTLK